MKKSAIGLLLVLIGCVFLIDNLGWIDGLTRYIFTWPTILIVIGIGLLASGKFKPALVLFLVGGFFWVNRYYHYDMSTYWPVILIVVGIFFILRHISSGNSNDDEIDEVCVFSGTERKYSSQAFAGGKVTTLFGGAELDLRETTPVEGATIDIFTMFGGTEITVPQDWNVQLDATALLGGISDERKNVSADGPKMRIKGFVMFGGVEIRS